MSYFDSLLEKRGLDACPLPLWKLKVTDEEYKELRELLQQAARFHGYASSYFSGLHREASLFFAEYWRREYNTGSHSIQMVFDGLRQTETNEWVQDCFYKAACRGARALGIERYKGWNSQILNDMLYQGGLPMKLLTEGVRYSVWDRFVRGLVNRHIDFEALDLGLVAKQSNGLRDYCNQLILGIESEQYMLMPFYCEDNNNRWFAFLKELAHQERVRQRHLHPFTLNWEFRIDQIGKKIYTKYDLRGQQRLPLTFLEENELEEESFFSVQVRVNGKAVDTFDYANNFCRYAVVSKHPYQIGDSISLFIHNQNDPHLTGDLDMSVPHLLFEGKNGRYEMGNQLGRAESIILIPDGWDVENSGDRTIDNYLWDEVEMRGMRIGPNFEGKIRLTSSDGCIEFGQNDALYWTELMSPPLYHPNIEEPVYDASECQFSLNFDALDGAKSVKCSNIEYRNKRDAEWTKEPGYGEIFARAKDSSTGHFVTPIRLINVGHGLSIILLHADNDTCNIRVTWKHGHVWTNEGTRKADEVWEVRKENCEDPRRIHFTFTPDGYSNNQFTLSVKAPFMEFAIDDIYGKHIVNNSWVPYSEVDKYQYHLVGQNIKSYTYGDIERELKWSSDDKLYIIEKGKKVKSIPYEGSLLTLFDSREVLRLMLDRTSRNILEAEIEVKFTTSKGEVLTFDIKDSPFRIKQTMNDGIIVRTKGKQPARFHGMLKLAKLDSPDLPSVELPYDEQWGYVLPDEIRSWGKTIVYGRTRGRIYPGLIDTNGLLDKATRHNVREEAIASISQELVHATMGSPLWKRVIGWYHKVQKEDLPANSLLELECTSKSPKHLLQLAFVLYTECGNNEDREVLLNQLQSLSIDLAFQWYWVLPYLNGLVALFESFIDTLDNPEFISIYIRWALQQDKQSEYLQAIGGEEFFMNALTCLNSLVKNFELWIKQLCVSSLLNTYNGRPDEITKEVAVNIVLRPKEMMKEEVDSSIYVEHSQDFIGGASTFFYQYGGRGANDNEEWLYRRVRAVVAQLEGKLNLFEQNEAIRRSIIYCNKANLYRFVMALNNELISKRK